MPIFIMFGKHTQDSLKDVSVQRTKIAAKIIEKNGGKVISMYVVMGEHELVLTLDFPDAEKAMCASMGLKMLTGISLYSLPMKASSY